MRRKRKQREEGKEEASTGKKQKARGGGRKGGAGTRGESGQNRAEEKGAYTQQVFKVQVQNKLTHTSTAACDTAAQRSAYR